MGALQLESGLRLVLSKQEGQHDTTYRGTAQFKEGDAELSLVVTLTFEESQIRIEPEELPPWVAGIILGFARTLLKNAPTDGWPESLTRWRPRPRGSAVAE